LLAVLRSDMSFSAVEFPHYTDHWPDAGVNHLPDYFFR